MAAPSSTVEDYLKAIYLSQRSAADRVSTGAVASAVGVVPGTATTMVKALAEAGLARYEPRGGVRLTRAGERLALRVLRRHRLVELFLVNVLGLDWSEVHAEAEVLEHAVSDRVLDRLDAMLGYPQTDPHGDPIPASTGSRDEAVAAAREVRASLATCGAGRAVTVARVTDQSPEFLRFVGRSALAPGSEVTVESRDSAGDAVRLRTSAGAVTMGTAAAAKILVDGD